jgi:hypothetical protein
MGKPPRPGVSKRASQAAAVQIVTAIKLNWCDEVHRIATRNVPMRQRMEVREQVGLTLPTIMKGFDSDTLAVLVWLAKRMNGQPTLTWDVFLLDWPDPMPPNSIELWTEDGEGYRLDEKGKRVGDEPTEVDDPES